MTNEPERRVAARGEKPYGGGCVIDVALIDSSDRFDSNNALDRLIGPGDERRVHQEFVS